VVRNPTMAAPPVTEGPSLGPTTTHPRAARQSQRQDPRHVVGHLLGLLALVAAGLFFVVPMVWLLLAPTKSDYDLVAHNPFSFGSFGQIAKTWHLLYGFEQGAVLLWMRNSAIDSVGGTAIAVVISIPAGYGLAVTNFIGRKSLLTITLVVMLVPSNALVLPLFLGANDVHLVNSPLSVILPFAFFPFGVFLAYIYFSSTVPKDLLAAARIDGCNEWGTFRHVAAPLAIPVIGLVAFFNFVGNWNNFLLPFVMLPQSSRYPSPVGLEALLAASPAFNPSNGGADLAIYRPEIALAVILTIAPVSIVFLFAQRALVRGLLAGSTNE
jgi:multiple sugar transport system permease protein